MHRRLGTAIHVSSCDLDRHLHLHVYTGGWGPRYMLASCDFDRHLGLRVCTGGLRPALLSCDLDRYLDHPMCLARRLYLSYGTSSLERMLPQLYIICMFKPGCMTVRPCIDIQFMLGCVLAQAVP